MKNERRKREKKETRGEKKGGGGEKEVKGRKPERETAPINYECRKPVGSFRAGNAGTSPAVRE